MEKKYEVNINAQERRVEEIRSLYKEMLLDSTTDVRRRELVDAFMKCRKSDGSFSTIDDYHIDSDCVVYFALIPTYCASAALVAAELKGICTAETNEALLGGLKFAATMRGLIGHGFDATHDLLEAIGIYKDAGIYKWLKQNPGKAPEFETTIRKRILEMKEALAENRVFSDWDRNFSVEFTTEVEDYEREMYDYVWYVSYGSNLSRERFMNYINRCTDKSEPVEDRIRTFDFSMYFADKTVIWGNKKGGSAFIDVNRPGMTFCRMYKIKRSQFNEIMAMEGPKYTKKVDLDHRSLMECPCYTFTAPSVYEETNAPCKEYFDTILTGLKEMYPEKSETILKYYLVSKILTDDDFSALKQIRFSAHAIKGIAICGLKTNKRRQASVKKLKALNLIKEDSRSVAVGLKITDYDALLYTVEDERELIEMLLIGLTMKGGM